MIMSFPSLKVSVFFLFLCVLTWSLFFRAQNSLGHTQIGLLQGFYLNFRRVSLHFLHGSPPPASVINNVMGNAPLGFYLGYQQLLFDNKKFLTVVNVDRPVEKMAENQGARIEPFPDLPI